MAVGFERFDRRHTENFCCATLLMALDAEPSFRDHVRAALIKVGGIDAEWLGPTTWGRELSLRDEGNQARRSDLWLRFSHVGSDFLVVLEMKVRHWDPATVSKQCTDMLLMRSKRKRLTVKRVILLAPPALTTQVRRTTDLITCIPWSLFIASLPQDLGAVSAAAVRNLENVVGRTISLEQPLVAPGHLAHATQVVSCLRALIYRCIESMGGTPKRQLNLSSYDGHPYSDRDGWEWHGISVPFSNAHRRDLLLGIYQYVGTPEGEEAYLDGAWLELYAGQDCLFDLRFPDSDLSAEALTSVQGSFLEALEQESVRKMLKGK